MPDLNATTLEAAERMIVGTARNMGLNVKNRLVVERLVATAMEGEFERPWPSNAKLQQTATAS